MHQNPADLEAQTAAKASRVDVASPIDVGPNVDDLAVVVHNFTNSREQVRMISQHSFPDKDGPRLGRRHANGKKCGRPRTSPDGNEAMLLDSCDGQPHSPRCLILRNLSFIYYGLSLFGRVCPDPTRLLQRPFLEKHAHVLCVTFCFETLQRPPHHAVQVLASCLKFERIMGLVKSYSP